MYGLNRVILIGNVATDLDFRPLSSGDSVLRFRLVTSERWKDIEGEKQEKAEWHNIVIFNDTFIKLASSSLVKGDRVMIEGQLHTRKWQGKDGYNHFKTEVILHKSRGKLLLMRRHESANVVNETLPAFTVESANDYSQALT